MKRAIVTLLTLGLAVGLPACADDSATSRPRLGPVVPGPELDGIDRTRSPACAASMRWAVGVAGRVVDERGQPVEGAFGQICVLVASGRRACLPPGTASATGVFTVPLEEELRCVDELAFRVVDPTRSGATTYDFAPGEASDGVIYAPADVVLFEREPATDLPAVGDPTAMRTTSLADGAEVTLAPASLYEGTYESLGSRLLSRADRARVAVGANEPMDAVLVIGPESPVDGAGASVRIPTTLAAGSRAEIFELGGLYSLLPDGTGAPEGRWRSIVAVDVAADRSVSTPPGVTLGALGWVGVRAVGDPL